MWKKATSLVFAEHEGELLVFNTFNGKMISVPLKQKEQITRIFDNPDEYADTPAFDKLKEMAFLVRDTVSIYQLTENQFAKRYIENSYLGLTIMPTEMCNFRCVYCYEDHLKPKMTRAIQDALIDYVQKNLKYHKGLWIEWFGGEPLLALDAVEYLSEHFMALCRQYKKPYKAGMTTNGYLLDHDTFEKLLRLRVMHFQITIDAGRDIHDRQRPLTGGGPTFDRVMQNLMDIRDLNQDRLWGITIRTNVSKNMLGNLDEFIDMLKDEFYDDRRFTFVLRKMWSNQTDCSDEIECEDETYNQIFEGSLQNGFVSKNDYQMAHNLGYVCYAAKPHNFVIGSDGRIYKCTVQFENEMNHVGDFSEDGSVHFDAEKLSYWNVPNERLIHKCVECSIFPTCASRSCPAKGYQKNCEAITDDIKASLKTFKTIAYGYCNMEGVL